MKMPIRIKFLFGIALSLSIAASTLVATSAGAQDRTQPKPSPPSSFMPVIEEPFEVVRARDKANKARVMAATSMAPLSRLFRVS